MAGETIITVVGNLTADPEMRFTPTGDAVANFTIASTSRKFDRQTNAWVDGDTTFLRANVWRKLAENFASSARKGDHVIAQGALVQRSYETREGEKRTVYELQVTEIGLSARFRSWEHTRDIPGAGGGGGRGGAPAQGQTSRSGAGDQPADDPWATPAGGGGGGGYDDVPPF